MKYTPNKKTNNKKYMRNETIHHNKNTEKVQKKSDTTFSPLIKMWKYRDGIIIITYNNLCRLIYQLHL